VYLEVVPGLKNAMSSGNPRHALLEGLRLRDFISRKEGGAVRPFFNHIGWELGKVGS
jgi:hypothetical protein